MFGSLSIELSVPEPGHFVKHKRGHRNGLEHITNWVDTAMIAASKHAPSPWLCFLPQSVKLPLTVRTWGTGDRMVLSDGSTKKLGDIFTDAKIPRMFRAAWAVVCDADGNILWLPALADSHAMQMAATDEPAWLLKLSSDR